MGVDDVLRQVLDERARRLDVIEDGIADVLLLPPAVAKAGRQRLLHLEHVAFDVAIDQVPAAVQAVIKRESSGGVVEDVEAEKVDGKTTYEVDIIRGTRKIELQIAEDGTVLERESKAVKQKA